MKNKSMIGLQSQNHLLIFGVSVALLVSTSTQIVSASVEGGTPGPNTSNSNQSAAESCSPMDPRCNADISCETDPEKCVPPNNAEQSQGGSQGSVPPNNADVSCEEDPMCGQAIDHINQAQSALQNGDTEGANGHLDLAKQALGCNPLDPRGC
jgi:hypothetical protein